MVLIGVRCLILTSSDACLHAIYSLKATVLLRSVLVICDAVSIETLHYNAKG